jgi:hypothetical protein
MIYLILSIFLWKIVENFGVLGAFNYLSIAYWLFLSIERVSHAGFSSILTLLSIFLIVQSIFYSIFQATSTINSISPRRSLISSQDMIFYYEISEFKYSNFNALLFESILFTAF